MKRSSKLFQTTMLFLGREHQRKEICFTFDANKKNSFYWLNIDNILVSYQVLSDYEVQF